MKLKAIGYKTDADHIFVTYNYLGMIFRSTLRLYVYHIGRGDTVTLSYEEYKNMKSRIELLEILAEADDDVKNDRVAPVAETFDDLRKILL